MSVTLNISDPNSGTGVSLYGMYSADLPHADGLGTYSIDGGPSTTFTIPGGGDMSVYNRNILGVNGLSKQTHTIVITYTSDSGSTPLVVSDLFIEGGTNLRPAAPGGSSSVGSSSTASSDAAPSDTASFRNEGAPPSSKPPIGAIVGSVLGGVAVLLLLSLLALYWRRRRIKLRQSDNSADQPFHLTREENRGLVSAPPTAIYANLPGSPSSPQTPSHHPAARGKHGPTLVPANPSFVVSPYTEPSHTNSSSPSTPSRAILHEDSGVRLPGSESDVTAEFPPLYTAS